MTRRHRAGAASSSARSTRRPRATRSSSPRWCGCWPARGVTGRRRSPELAIPQGVRDVVGRRLDRLSPRPTGRCTVGAAIGRDFEPGLLADVTGLEAAELRGGARGGGRGAALPSAPSERFRFAHALVRETLYGELSAAQRQALHSEIAAAMEARYGAEEGRVERRPRRAGAPLPRGGAAPATPTRPSTTRRGPASARSASSATRRPPSTSSGRSRSLELCSESDARAALPSCCSSSATPRSRAATSTAPARRWSSAAAAAKRTGRPELLARAALRRRRSPATSASSTRARRAAGDGAGGDRAARTARRARCSSRGSRRSTTGSTRRAARPSCTRRRSRWRGGSATRGPSPGS